MNNLVYSNQRICFSHFLKNINRHTSNVKYFLCKVGYMCLDRLRHIQYTHYSPLVSTIVSYLNVLKFHYNKQCVKKHNKIVI